MLPHRDRVSVYSATLLQDVRKRYYVARRRGAVSYEVSVSRGCLQSVTKQTSKTLPTATATVQLPLAGQAAMPRG